VKGGGLAYRSSKTAVTAVTMLTAQAFGEEVNVIVVSLIDRVETGRCRWRLASPRSKD